MWREGSHQRTAAHGTDAVQGRAPAMSFSLCRISALHSAGALLFASPALISALPQCHPSCKTRQYINEPGIDFVRHLSASAKAAGVDLDFAAVQNRLNPTWVHALANELAEENLSAQGILDLIVKRSFVIDRADYKRVYFSGPKGKPYVPPNLTCGHKGDSAGKCSCAAFRTLVPTVAATGKGVDWTQYALCPSAAAMQNFAPEWLGDITVVGGLKAALLRDGRCDRCRQPGDPHYFRPRNERSAWYWDKTGSQQSRGSNGSPFTPSNAALARKEGEPPVVEIKN